MRAANPRFLRASEPLAQRRCTYQRRRHRAGNGECWHIICLEAGGAAGTGRPHCKPAYRRQPLFLVYWETVSKRLV